MRVYRVLAKKLEKVMAPYFSVLAWRIPGTAGPGGLPSLGLRRVGLWVKAQHEGALPPPCIVRKDPRVPHTARRGA